MADLVVGMAKTVVDGALTKAQAAIEEEGKLRQSAARNLVFITGEFEMMKSFLEVADRERLENPVVKTWVRQISDLAYDVEDCIEFVVHLDKKNRWWIRLLKPVASCLSLAPLPLDVAVDELERLKARVEDVSSRNTRYSLISDSGSKPAVPAASGGATAAVNRPFNAALKAIQDHSVWQWDLTQLLTMSQLGVFAIWGTGDIGLASILWNFYAAEDTCGNFRCRAWVELTHPFHPHDFIRSLTEQFYANQLWSSRQMEDSRGEDPLKDFKLLVIQNRFLVVLEGLTSMLEWDAIRRFLPDLKNGSCIILSTQRIDVATLAVGEPYQVSNLKPQSAEHPVYAFFQKPYSYSMESYNDGVSILARKKEEASKWMSQHPLLGRMKESRDLGINVSVTRSKRRQVMSVWGIGGVGKSALIKNLFCDKILMSKLFHKYGWVDVSHPFNLWDFSRDLLSNIGSEYLEGGETANLHNMRSKDTILECREILRRNKCLVVIDGLQSTEDWDLIKADLVSESNSKNVFIVVTTEQEIATHCCGDKQGAQLVFNVKCLEADTAFELFKKVAKKGEDAELRELTSICGGLPRVIVEIAGSFAKDRTGWKKALSANNKFMLEVETNSEFNRLRSLFGWMNLYLRKCFHNFPDSLKPCILYLPIFPRNYPIRRRRLVRRWIAEGYSRDSHEVSAEMTGEKQFSNLLDLSIIQQQPAFSLGDDTRPVFCQVNGFFREYIISRQMEENLMLELRGSSTLTTQRTGRHLVISESWVRDRIVFENIDFSRLRSLTVFGNWKSYFVSESMKLLRVLDLEGATEVENSDLKKIVKSMCRLKYLSLRGCREICHLPSSIGDLWQLQSLDVRHTSIDTLPVSITKLQKLQYIRADTTAPAPHHHAVSNCWSGRRPVGVVVPPGIGKLTALNTLGVVNVSASGTMAVLEDLKKLTHLHKLGVSGINKNNSKKFFLGISVLVRLESLSVRLQNNNEGALDDIPLCLENLRSLKLYGLRDRLPEWREQLTMLVKMDLEIAKLPKGVFKFLGGLPKLCILRLHVKGLLQDNRLDVCVAVTTDNLTPKEKHSFESIKIFEIACSSCSRVTFGRRTMKKLEQMKVDCCIGSLLSGLKHLRELKEVLLKGSSCSDEVLKASLMTELENYPRQPKPVIKLEELPSSA